MPLDPTPLFGRHATILGGSGGIGGAIARLLAEAGASIAVVANSEKAKAAAVAGKLPGGGHTAHACAVEDGDALTGCGKTAAVRGRRKIESPHTRKTTEHFAPPHWRTLFRQSLRSRWPCEPFFRSLLKRLAAEIAQTHILVNSAGFTQVVPHADLETLTDELFDRVLRINTRGGFSAVRAFAPLLRASGNGLVVNISSIAATTGAGSSVAYCAAKAGMDVMGMALARALAPAIRVLTVSPGVVDTEFVPCRDQAAREKQGRATPLGMLCTVNDVAAVVLACATTLSYSTGSVIQVDGGRHL